MPHKHDSGAFGRPGPIVPSGKVLKSPSIDRRSVPCPDCGAEVGEGCHWPSAGTSGVVHRSRHRLTNRQHNATVDSTAYRHALRRRPEQREQTRITAGLTGAQLATLVGLHPNTIKAYETGRSRPIAPAAENYRAWLYTTDTAPPPAAEPPPPLPARHHPLPPGPLKSGPISYQPRSTAPRNTGATT